jgi:hypothetical protein
MDSQFLERIISTDCGKLLEKRFSAERLVKAIFYQSRFWIWTDKIARYRGLKIEQLSDFSTVRAGYPQFLGSYPQFGRYVV